MDKRKFYKLKDGSIVNIDAIGCIKSAYGTHWEIVLIDGTSITITEQEYNGIYNNMSSAETFIRLF